MLTYPPKGAKQRIVTPPDAQDDRFELGIGLVGSEWFAYAAVHDSAGVREIVELDVDMLRGLARTFVNGWRPAVPHVEVRGAAGGHLRMEAAGPHDAVAYVVGVGGTRTEATYLRQGLAHMVIVLVERMDAES